MEDDDTNDLIPRRELLKVYPFSDSAERRGRTPGPWPPHVTIGKKIYYRRQSVERWLAQQERASIEGRRDGLRALFPDLDEGAYQLAEELVERAPARKGQAAACR